MTSMALYISAASVAFIHTVLGPDHYLPFVVISRARNWSPVKTFWITFICGIGHVASSVLLGIVGIALGVALNKLVHIEAIRGDLAAWALIVFGLGYFFWGIYRSRKHVHRHLFHHKDIHIHEGDDASKISITPWVLFIIFVLGPCEPLIPLFIYPAAHHHLFDVLMVTTIFSVITIATMLGITFLGYYGFKMIPLRPLERYMHAMAGFVILLCGISIQFLGL